MYTLIASAEYPKEMDANPTESLGVMICELKDQDSNMTAVGSGLRLVENTLQCIIGCLIQSRSFSLCTFARNHIRSA